MFFFYLIKKKKKNSTHTPTSRYSFLNLSCVDFQSTPLHLAAGYNRVRVVQLLLQHGADVHAKDKG